MFFQQKTHRNCVFFCNEISRKRDCIVKNARHIHDSWNDGLRLRETFFTIYSSRNPSNWCNCWPNCCSRYLRCDETVNWISGTEISSWEVQHLIDKSFQCFLLVSALIEQIGKWVILEHTNGQASHVWVKCYLIFTV